MQILDWIASRRVETKSFISLFCLVLLSMPAFSVAQTRQQSAQITAFNTPALDVAMTGTVQQLVTTHTSGLQLVVDGPQGSFTASLGSGLSSETRQSLSQGVPVQLSVIKQTINGKQYLLIRKLTVDGRQTIIRNDNGFLVHAPSRHPSASVTSAALYRSSK